MRGRAIVYSAAEMQWLEAHRALIIGDYHARFVATFGRVDVARSNLNSLRKRQGWTTGRSGHFQKGAAPANKGKKCPPGRGGRHPNAQRTQFKKGAMPHTYKGAGHERVDSKDGYVVLILDEPNPWSGGKTRPVHKHRYLWEQANGPVPDGHVLKCLDGDKTNCDPSNWIAIPRALLPHLNGRWCPAFDAAAPEAKPALLTLAKLKHARNQRKVRGPRAKTSGAAR